MSPLSRARTSRFTTGSANTFEKAPLLTSAGGANVRGSTASVPDQMPLNPPNCDEMPRDADDVVVAREGKRPSTASIYVSLTKPRLSTFVVMSTGVGYLMAPVPLYGLDLLATVVGTALTVASANAGNQWLEVEYDKNMQRTRLRALPRKLIAPSSALAFSVACGVAGTALLWAGTNSTAALLAAGNILLYCGIYTPMKRVHWSNTWIGAVVGAVPPLIGWTAATGGEWGTGSLALFAVLYAWQIPHFLSLSWTVRHDYAAGGYQMLSRHFAHKVAPQTLLWSLYTLPLGTLCW
jgi:protoheme IX farnesyltransferase